MTGSAPTPPKNRGINPWLAAETAPGEITPAAPKDAFAGGGPCPDHHGGLLHETVTACVRQYLEEIDGEPTTDFYQLVLSQVEPPLLREVMAYTRHNQTRAAELLGLNRGTLRKKLRQYDIPSDSV